MSNFNLHLGDNLATLKNYPDNHFDSIVTDPPYGIDFLGKAWDANTGSLELYKECLRVLKPGGYLLAFSAARTYHQLAYNVERAGFEIRDQLMWLYSSGFPKAQDIGKAIQKRVGVKSSKPYVTNNPRVGGDGEFGADGSKEETICTSPTAKEWEGYKTALKPAHEPIVMARKPFKGSTIDNVLKNGLGAMNIDATRIEQDELSDRYPSNVIGEVADGYQKYFYCPKVSRKERHIGFAIGESTVEALESIGGKRLTNDTCFIPGLGDIKIHGAKHEVQKIRNREKEKASESLRKVMAGEFLSTNDKIRAMGGTFDDGHIKIGNDTPPRCAIDSIFDEWLKKHNAPPPNVGNNHPTVKPVALMEYLVKLVTPPSTPTLQRKVLDPFMGSGSTGMAVTKLGHHFTGCDLDPNYVKIAETRITAWNAPETETNPLPEDLFGEE